MHLTWLDDPTVDAVRNGLRTVAPGLADAAIVPRGLEPSDDPQWCAASAVVDERFVVKFAWAQPPTRRIWHEAQVLDTLRAAAPRLPLPELVAFSATPTMLVTRRVSAVPYFDVRHLIGPAHRHLAARDLAGVLADLHHPAVLQTVSGAIGPLPDPTTQAATHTTTDVLRDRFGALVGPDQRDRVLSWCDWADHTLAAPGRTALVHGDFHGGNHLWDRHTLRLNLIVDLETVGVSEPEFDLRCLPGDCGIDMFTAIVAHYQQLTGATVDMNRIMAWHFRTVLGDALWRAEAGVALPDKRTPAQWVDDLKTRFTALGTFD
jgi:aminoglycoside phosphotransferase (APT) family kinase protein